jgi:hypothetical protein
MSSWYVNARVGGACGVDVDVARGVLCVICNVWDAESV